MQITVGYKSDKLFDVSVYAILGFVGLIVIYPLYFVIIASISDPNAVYRGEVILIPRGLTLEGYKLIFDDPRIFLGYRNTIIYATGFALLSVSMSILTGYSLSRPNLVGRRAIMIFFLVTLYFNGGLIPTYIMVQKLGLINKFYTMWILGSLSVFHVILARTYFNTAISTELLDASDIDGCNQFQTLLHVVLPLAKPIIAVLTLYAVVQQWNSYFGAMIYLNEAKYYPLQLILREILVVSQQLQNVVLDISSVEDMEARQKLADLVRFGVIIVSSLPLLVAYPFLQRFFVQGVMIGSLKG